MRQIIIEAGEPDHPVELQIIQEAGAHWNGQTIELTLNVVLSGKYETLGAPISLVQANLLLQRLKTALVEARRLSSCMCDEATSSAMT